MILSPSDLSIEDYHASTPEWLSKTNLRDFAKMHPAEWHATYVTKVLDRKAPGGVDEGKMLDCVLTEGWGAFGKRYVQAPDEIINPKTGEMYGRTSKAFTTWSDQTGLEVVDENEMCILKACYNAVTNHPKWPEISRCQAQMSIRRKSNGLGIGLQSRPDWINFEEGVMFDLKKTRDLNIFGKQAIDLGYHLQAAIARWALAGEGVSIERAYLVACDWSMFPKCRVYQIPEFALVDGELEMRGLAADIADRMKNGFWGDVVPDEEELPIPGWMKYRMENHEC
jgi:hypothetical protein